MRRIVYWLVMLAVLLPSSAVSARDEPYKVPVAVMADPTADHSAFQEWKNIQPKLRHDKAVIEQCLRAEECTPEAQALAAIVQKARPLQGFAQLAFVHQSVKEAITFTDDVVQWKGEVEHWSGPLETFRTKKGDCEDYALAEYVLLLLLGYDPSDLRMLVERLRKEDNVKEWMPQSHLVLAVGLKSSWFILDCNEATVVNANAQNRELIVPQYVLNWREGLPRQEAAAQPAK